MSFSGLRIGLLGGSFNPAHNGHLEMSDHALKQLQLDQVWWLVSPQNPIKPSDDMAPLDERLQKASVVAQYEQRIIVTDLETQLGTTYTIDTLRAIKSRFKETKFVWLMGMDNLEQIHLWKEWEEIFHTVAIAVFNRPGYGKESASSPAASHFASSKKPAEQAKDLANMEAPAWLILNNPPNYISASKIRKSDNKLNI